MKKIIVLLAVLFVAGFSFYSCVKDSTPAPGYNVVETGVNSTQLMETPLDLYLQADRAIRFQRDSIISKGLNQATATFKIGYISLTVAPADTITFPKTLTLDFGSDTSKAYTGKMIIRMTGNMRNSGSKCFISYQNLITGNSLISGTDSIFSSGKNSSGSIVSQYNMHGGQLVGYKSKTISYNGRIIGKFNLSSGTNIIDSLEIKGTDANLFNYRLYSYPNYRLQVLADCNYFNFGVIISDITINGILTGNMAFDFGYSPLGFVNGCDYNGAIYAYSYLNKNYTQQYLFVAKKFY